MSGIRGTSRIDSGIEGPAAAVSAAARAAAMRWSAVILACSAFCPVPWSLAAEPPARPATSPTTTTKADPTARTSESATADDPIAEGLEEVRLGHYQKAKPLLEKGLKTSPGSLAGRLALVRAHLELDEYEEALPLANKAVADVPGSSEAHYWLAQAYGLKALRISRVRALFLADDIQREYKTAVILDPRNVEAHHGLMRFYMIAPSFAGGSLEKAREQAEAIVPIDPIRGLTDLARVAYEMKDDAAVLSALDRMGKIDPGQAFLGKAQYYMQKKDSVRAAAELARIAEQKPVNVSNLMSAASLYQGLERWDDAMALLARVEAEEPGNRPAMYQVGRACLLSKRDLPRAETAFKQYLAAEPPPGAPNHASAHWRLGQVYLEMGRKADARREIEEAVRQAPANEDFKKSLAALK